jgi:hypothetical protein
MTSDALTGIPRLESRCREPARIHSGKQARMGAQCSHQLQLWMPANSSVMVHSGRIPGASLRCTARARRLHTIRSAEIIVPGGGGACAPDRCVAAPPRLCPWQQPPNGLDVTIRGTARGTAAVSSRSACNRSSGGSMFPLRLGLDMQPATVTPLAPLRATSSFRTLHIALERCSISYR